MDTKGKTTKRICQYRRNPKQNQDFQNIPAASKKTNPPDIDKEDVQKSSKTNQEKRITQKIKELLRLYYNEKRKVPSHTRRNFSF